MKHSKSLSSVSLLALLLSFQAHAGTDTEIIAELENQVERVSDQNHSHEATATDDSKGADSTKNKKAKEIKGAKQEEIVPLTEENPESNSNNAIKHYKI